MLRREEKVVIRRFFKLDEKGRRLLVVVPKRDEMPKGVLLSILQQSNLSREEFIELLK